AGHPLVPAGRRDLRDRRGHRAGGRLDGHRGGPPAVDRLRDPAHPRRRQHRTGAAVRLLRGARGVHGADRAHGVRVPAPGPRARRAGRPAGGDGRMSRPEVVLALMWAGLTAYTLFGGADFGAGAWDLLAGGARAGAARRRLVEHSIGPVWEANHVWLIFVLVVLWTGFPPAFAAIASTLYLPLTLAAF